MKHKKKLYIIIIAITLLGTIGYHALNKAPQKWDSAAHMNLSMLYALKLTEGRFAEIPTVSGYYPPLVHLIGSIVYLIVAQPKVFLAVTFMVHIIGLIYLYKLAYDFFKNTSSALLACTIYSLLPQVFVESRLYQLDLPLTTFIIIALYYLHSSQRFSNKKHTILFFLFAAFAQLTKWYGFLYMIVPFLYTALKTKGNLFKEDVLVTVVGGIGLALVINLPWYAINFNTILDFFGTVSSLGELNDPEIPLSVASFTEYLQLSLAYQISFPIFILITFAAAYLVSKKDTKIKYFLAAIVVPWIAFTLLKNKDVRYIMPILPYMIMILVTFMEHLKINKKRVRIVLEYLLFAYLITLYVFLSFNQITSLANRYSFISAVYASPWNRYKWLSWEPSELAYKKDVWQIQEVYEYMLELDKYTDKNAKVLFGVDFPYFNSINFNTLQIQNATYYKVSSGFDIYYLDLDDSLEDTTRALEDFEYILTSYNPGLTELRHFENMVKINRFLQKQGDEYFQAKAVYKLPNGEEVYLFKKVKQ